MGLTVKSPPNRDTHLHCASSAWEGRPLDPAAEAFRASLHARDSGAPILFLRTVSIVLPNAVIPHKEQDFPVNYLKFRSHQTSMRVTGGVVNAFLEDEEQMPPALQAQAQMEDVLRGS
jgi:hypothetical protein